MTPAVAQVTDAPPASVLAVHLPMIQAVIGRMGQNAFAAKTWAITVMAGVFALGPGFTGTKAGAIIVIALVLFWAMDAYFLRQEHLFRRLYDAAVGGAAPAFTMDASQYAGDVGSHLRFMLLPGVWPVHVLTVVAVSAKALKG